jgi:hypothetical protein
MDLRKRYRDYVAAGGEIKGPYGHILDGGPRALPQSHGSETAWKR